MQLPVPSVELPASILPVLPWVGAAFAVVLAAWLAVRFLGAKDEEAARAEAERHGLLIPSSEPDPEDLVESPAPSKTVLGRKVVVGVAVVAITVLGVFAYLSLPGSGDDGPEYVRSTPEAPRGPQPTRSARAVQEGREIAIDAEVGAQLVVWAGNEQTGRLGELLRRSLAVVLLDEAGRPMVDRVIRFDVERGGGRVDRDSVRTSDSGLATTAWRLGTDPNALAVRAYVADRPQLAVRFTATADRSSRSGSGPTPREGPESAATSQGDLDTAGSAPARTRTVAPPVRAPRWTTGGVHTCRVDGAGAIACWGANAGEGNPALDAVIWGVEAGVFHVCGVTDASTVGCWSVASADGQIITGERPFPSDAEPVELAVGSEHACARSDEGAVYCWGSNQRGQLGTGSGSRSQPTRVPELTDVTQIAAGWFHTCALTRPGDVFCWGANDAGQLGTGSTSDSGSPTPLRQPAPFSALTAGSGHTCGLAEGGGAWCWGENQYGQLGTGALTATVRPTEVDTDLAFRSLVAGGVHTCGLTGAGNAWCWGRNLFGQLGDGSTDDSTTPVPVDGGHRFVRLDGGGAHTCGETMDSGLYCWGNNIQGQVGDGTRDNRSRPVRAGGVR